MIYLFAGDDAKTKNLNYEKFIKSELSSLEIFNISKNDFDKVQVESFYSGSGLFFTKCAIVFSSILEKEEIQDFILERLDLMSESINSFVFIEGRLNKPILDAFKKSRAELNVFELPKEKKEKFNNFLLADAFGQRDKLNLWIYFTKAVHVGVGMEELIGVLFWKIKDMLLKKNFVKFKEEELKSISAKLSYLLPEARKKDLNAEVVFENFLLDVL